MCKRFILCKVIINLKINTEPSINGGMEIINDITI